MLDIGWSELMVIGVLALIVVGPKELPRLLRTVGQFVGKARSIAREFQRSMDEAAREADLKELTDLKRDMDRMGRVDFSEQAKRSASSLTSGGKKSAPTAEPAASDRPSDKPATPAAPPAAPAEEPAEPTAEAEPKRAAEPDRHAASGER